MAEEGTPIVPAPAAEGTPAAPAAPAAPEPGTVVLTQAELDKTIAKAIATREKAIQEQMQKEKEEAEALARGESERILAEYKAKVEGTEGKLSKAETALAAYLDRALEGLPEELRPLVAGEDAAAKLEFIGSETFQAVVARFAGQEPAPSGTGGSDLGKAASGKAGAGAPAPQDIAKMSPEQAAIVARKELDKLRGRK